MRAWLLALVFLLAPGAATADGLDDYIEEQRESEQDDWSLPAPPDLGDGLEEEIRFERCVEEAIDNGLLLEQAEAWCDR